MRFAIERGAEPVSAAGYRGDDLGPEQLAQCTDLHLQVVFLDYQTRPDQFQQLALGDEPVAALDQCHQQIEGARADTGDHAIDPQLPLLRPHFDPTETQRIGHAQSLSIRDRRSLAKAPARGKRGLDPPGRRARDGVISERLRTGFRPPKD